MLGAGALVLNTAVFGLLIWQLKLLRRQVADSSRSLDLATSEAAAENVRQRKQTTLDFIGTTIEKQHDLFGRLKTDAQFMEKASDRDTVEYLVVRDYLSYLEDLSVGVNMEVFDREVVDRSIGGRIIRVWFELYGDWIQRERTDLDSDRLYEEVEALAKSLKASRDAADRSRVPAEASRAAIRTR
ncbi:DUF4760 domain-containing protein [Nocardia sp. CS682]|uniref:DUF4760 domain-containing protein n=1 Tax=Nocardia sp. CS682 TaxID=1047172 RepID=UPI0014317371|nr:DUF4760 domain-containing protein [Nocardia sp. CS682]